ncbi:MAG: hypothetical protein ABIO16_06815 [Nocardioides sp.]
MLLAAAALTIGACLVALAWGYGVRRSLGHDAAAYAAAAAGFVAAAGYGATWAQGLQGPPDRIVWMGAAFVVGGAAYVGIWAVAGPVRTPQGSNGAQAPPDERFELPAAARLAWVGRITVPWWERVVLVAFTILPTAGLVWWLGLSIASLWPIASGVTLGTLIRTRDRQVVVDYSGVGVRGRWAPSAIPMSLVSSAEAMSLIDAATVTTSFEGGSVWRRSGEALVVHRRGARDYVFAVDSDAAEAAAVLNTHIERQRRWEASRQSPSSIDLPHPYGDRV